MEGWGLNVREGTANVCSEGEKKRGQWRKEGVCGDELGK